ncbi:MAG: hypothetical protein LBM77_13660 [Spirochaetaceae bacterium]|jgi:antitoxin YefM|nr:hypothetical protein [Spirochaetaceae bacterium]
MGITLSVEADKINDDFIRDVQHTYHSDRVVVLEERDYERMRKAYRNAEYMAMLDKSFKELEEGKVVVKTMEELEAMANG